MGLIRGRSAQPIYYGWWVVMGALAATALFGGLYTWSFGLYFAPVETAFGWTRTEVSLGVSIALLAAGAVSPFVGRLADRQGPRLVVLIGALLGAGGMMLLSTASALWHWYLYSGLMGLAVAMAFFIGLQALAANWFEQRRGKALGLLGLGVSLGGFALVPVVRLMIDTLGWEGSLQLSAGLVLVLYLPLVFFVFRNGPARQADGSHPDAPVAAAGTLPTAEGVSLRTAMRTPIFWTLTLGISLYFYAAFGLVVHSVPFFEDEGFSASEAAGFLSAMAGVSILSRIVLAATVDRARRFERVAMLLAISGMITLGLLLIGTSPGVIVVFVLFWSIADTGPALIEPLSLSRAFGAAHFGSILGAVSVVRTVAMLASAGVAGAIFDGTGSYTWALVMFLGAYGGALAFFLASLRLPRPIDLAVSRPALAGGSD